jgi:hypothetical protein
MRSTVCAIRSELKETIKHEMKAAIQPIWSKLVETTTSREATETKPNPGMMQSIEEHQEGPKGEAARKQRRVRNLAAKRLRKRKERTRGNSGSRRKSAAAFRKVSRHAKMAWRKRNRIRNIRTLKKCGRRKEFSAGGIRTTRCAKVARHKEQSHEGPSAQKGRRKEQTRNKFTIGTPKG